MSDREARLAEIREMATSHAGDRLGYSKLELAVALGYLLAELEAVAARSWFLSARVTELETALRRYGVHKVGCSYYKRPDLERRQDDCDCDFAAALAGSSPNSTEGDGR